MGLFWHKSKPEPPKFTDSQVKTLADAIISASRPVVVNRYDALRSDPLRKPYEIRYDLTETEQMFDASKRINAYAAADHLYDNDSVGSTLDTVVRVTIGTTGGMPIFTEDKDAACQAHFNKWKRTCGFTEGEPYSDMLALILRLVKLHGDCVILLDPILTGNKLRIWDADQICSISTIDFARWADAAGGVDVIDGQVIPWRQVEGVVIDGAGRVKGYFVTNLRNRYSVSLDDATFLPATLARRISYHKKVTQYRGEPLFLPNSEITEDTRSLLKSEVQAAKNNAELAMIYKRPASQGNSALSALLDGMTPEEATAGTGMTPEDLNELASAAAPDHDFKAFEGKSAIGEIPSDSDIIKLSNDRPSSAVQSWMDNLADTNGKRMGVMSLFARGRADNSYSSGQIEVSISWKQFEEDQKLLERQVVDYICGVLYPEATYTVDWPKAFEVDPQKAESTFDIRWRGGRTTLQELLGPHWRDRVRQLAAEKRFLEAEGLTNLSFFQTASGATVQENTQELEEEPNE